MKPNVVPRRTILMRRAALMAFTVFACAAPVFAQLAIRGRTVYTMAGTPIEDGVILIADGRIDRVGTIATVTIPDDYHVLDANVVIPGIIDAHATIGLTGYLNQAQDQDVLERSEPLQPELRATDAYNPRERLVEWVRSFGVTTLHTGHAPGEVISGQTMIVKTAGGTVDDAVVVPTAMIACTVGDWSVKGEKKSPGTRSKSVALLRAELIKAGEYLGKIEKAERAGREAEANADDAGKSESNRGAASSNEADEADDKKAPKKPDRNLRLEALGRVVKREIPLLVTAHRANDIAVALRIAKEFDIRIVLDGAAEAYLLIDEIKAAGVPVIIHPTMMRSHRGTTENASFETAAKLVHAGIPVAMQSGYESYVPKTRVVLFETAVAAAHGLSFDEALASCTIEAAKILGIDTRVGSIEAGKDADIALYDGDPFEYTTHCIGVVIDGEVVSDTPM